MDFGEFALEKKFKRKLETKNTLDNVLYIKERDI